MPDMVATLSLIPELEDVVQHGSAEKRVATLQRILDLWVELARAAVNGPEYRALTKQIHALSAEYRALTHTKKSK